MSDHTCTAIVVTCMDFRLQTYIEDWMQKTIGEKNYDRIAWAGATFDIFPVMKQVDVSVRLHDIKKAIFINHEDCGAYGATGTYERHKTDLVEAAKKVKILYPNLDIETYYLHLDGTFEKIS